MMLQPLRQHELWHQNSVLAHDVSVIEHDGSRGSALGNLSVGWLGNGRVGLFGNTCHTGLHRAHPPVPQELCSYIFVHRTAEMLQIAAVSAQARANVLDEDVSRAFQAFPMHPVISSQKGTA